MRSMKHIILFGLLLVVTCGVHAKPYYSYHLHGTVTGNAAAANSLADVDAGDEFFIRLNIWEKNSDEHKVSFQGVIGEWAFLEQQTVAYYHWGDSSPERFYTGGSDSLLNAPDGNGSTVYPYDIYLGLLGMEQTGTGTIPEEDRLIRETGEINLNQFRSGSFHFWFFDQDFGDTSGTEEDLFGSITRIIEVPEPGTLLLSAIGLVFLLIKQHPRYSAIKSSVIFRKELSHTACVSLNMCHPSYSCFAQQGRDDDEKDEHTGFGGCFGECSDWM